MAKPNRTLPEFNNPPVIETVLGVQFSPLQRFSILHYGLFWKKIRVDYPKCNVVPPLDPVTEQFQDETKKIQAEPKITVELKSSPEIRYWFIDSSETGLIQVQTDRFIHNWRKVKGDEVYPRYDSLKPRFKKEWQRFCEFLDEEELGSPEVNQCEVTYINNIEIDRELKSYGEVNKAIASWSGKSLGEFLREPEMVIIDVRYVIPGEKGRLYISVKPAIRRQDPKAVVQLNLIARGRPDSSRLEDVLKWFDLGHEWIVRGFTDFTTKEMHRYWERAL